MQAYVFSPDIHQRKLLSDLKEVRQACRGIPRDYWHQVRVSLEEFPSDRAAQIAAYNGEPKPAAQVLKKWRIGGPRGGQLIELDPAAE